MLGSIRDLTTVIIAGLIILVVLLVFFMMTLKGSELSRESFDIGLANFVTCTSSDEYTQTNYQNNEIITMNVDALADMRRDLDIESNCNSDFVISSDEQIQGYAQDVYTYVNGQYPEENFRLLDTVYTAPVKYYAYLNSPQDYLMFAMSSDESKMMAYVYRPGVDPEITKLWSIEDACDLELVQSYTNNILVKYYQKVM